MNAALSVCDSILSEMLFKSDGYKAQFTFASKNGLFDIQGWLERFLWAALSHCEGTVTVGLYMVNSGHLLMSADLLLDYIR